MYTTNVLMVQCNEKKRNKLQVKVKLPERNEGSTYGVGIERANWYEAEETCRQRDMRLVTIKGKHAAKRILEAIEAVRGRKNVWGGQFWTSGNDLAELGKFYWMSTGEEIDRYTNWMRQEPTKEERSYKNWQTSPHCIFLSQYKTNKYYWDYSPCTQKKFFICEQFDEKWQVE